MKNHHIETLNLFHDTMIIKDPFDYLSLVIVCISRLTSIHKRLEEVYFGLNKSIFNCIEPFMHVFANSYLSSSIFH